MLAIVAAQAITHRTMTAVIDKLMMPSTKPAVAMPEGLPRARVDLFLPITPKTTPRMDIMIPGIQLMISVTIRPRMPKTRAATEKPLPGLPPLPIGANIGC